MPGDSGQEGRGGSNEDPGPVIWINVRDPLYFLGYGIPSIYVKRILFSSQGNVGEVMNMQRTQ